MINEMVDVQVRLGTLDKQDAIFLRHLLNKAADSAHDLDTVDQYSLRLRGRGKRAKVAEKKGYDAENTLRFNDAERFAIYLQANVKGYNDNTMLNAIRKLQDTIALQSNMINSQSKTITTLENIILGVNHLVNNHKVANIV